jgi:hypothetical protein
LASNCSQGVNSHHCQPVSIWWRQLQQLPGLRTVMKITSRLRTRQPSNCPAGPETAVFGY